MTRGVATFALALALVVASVGLAGCGGSAEPPRRVVIVTFDTTRADRLGCYGYADAETPHLDRLAGVATLFENAVSPVPTTLPAHSTIFTGVYPQDHGVRYNLIYKLGPEAVTLAERLRETDYATAAFPATFILAAKHGLDQGFDTYVEPEKQTPGTPASESIAGRRAADGVDAVLGWLDGRDEDDRVFVWLHFYDPHGPYNPPFPYSARFAERPYDGEIAYTDAQFGRLVERLERLDPDWSETLLVVTADHGEGLHDHGERYHANLTYETTQHVPLLIREPGQHSGRRVARPVGIVDITPTVLDYVGLVPTANMRGASLRGAVGGAEAPARDLYFETLAGSLNYGWAELRGVRFGDWKLIDSSDPELFDLSVDPRELNNLASLEPDRLGDLRAALGDLADPLESATVAPQAHDEVLDAETEALLRSLGYVPGGSGGSAENAPHPRDLIDLEPELVAAQGAAAARQWERLVEVCTYVLSRDPTNKWALQNRVKAQLELGNPRAAQDDAAKLVELWPDSERSYSMLALTYSEQQRFDEAYEVLQAGIRGLRAAAPDKPQSGLLTYYSLVVAYEGKRPDLCEDELPQALVEFPNSDPMWVLLARCSGRDGDVEGALKSLGQAVERGFSRLDGLAEFDEFRAVIAAPGFAELEQRVAERVEAPS